MIFSLKHVLFILAEMYVSGFGSGLCDVHTISAYSLLSRYLVNSFLVNIYLKINEAYSNYCSLGVVKMNN